MNKLLVADRVVAEMDDIALFTATQWGSAQAIKYVAEMQQRFAWLADNPMLGSQRDEVGSGYRAYRQNSHIIFYLVEPDAIQIIGIPHATMALAAYFDP